MGKVKTTQVKGDEAEKIVLEYLRKQNRPYSATDISCNLHNSVTKASAAKVLALLEKQGEIAVKTYGKQSVYVIKQDSNTSDKTNCRTRWTLRRPRNSRKWTKRFRP
ncbi:Homologous-pairing protein 2 [Neolecta irregularis DAH-3]|uniref:Homologous-pairing protein 2 n=1 Tax=Neolecta irregularis (strain DAH-3) TaxID=1198029 RepID=A0A1U7LRT2_NEOID|nr:Homologous-pairing protein 2 [Neolecta irregularis DAH-3]|eukprot:OLL25354.1 Homologous-pairing protein 2 [Neolecta irregularis DAH-3]